MTRRPRDGGRQRLARLKRRSEFLRAAGRGRKWAAPGLVLQACKRDEADGEAAEPGPPRIGFTASRKVGNAVARNRARRRLRAVADQVLPQSGLPGIDYVLIARAATLSRPYMDLVGDLETALQRVAEDRPRRGRPKARRARGETERKGA
jgi:ribonuclease P protein component